MKSTIDPTAPGAGPGSTAAAGDGGSFSTPKSIGPTRENAPSPLSEQRTVLQRFLKAANWEERLPYTYRAEELGGAIAAYYSSHPDGALAEHELEFFYLEESVEAGGPYWMFFVTTPKSPQGYPAVVRRTPEGFKVDWECFVEFNDRLFEHFYESGQPGPTEFRVLLKRAAYWGPDKGQFSTLDDYLCFRVDLPYNELDYYAFVAADDAIAEEISDKVTWGLPPLAAIVKFQRVNFPHGQSHLKIVELVTDGWKNPAAK